MFSFLAWLIVTLVLTIFISWNFSIQLFKYVHTYIVRSVWRYKRGNQNPYIDKNRQYNGQKIFFIVVLIILSLSSRYVLFLFLFLFFCLCFCFCFLFFCLLVFFVFFRFFLCFVPLFFRFVSFVFFFCQFANVRLKSGRE